MADLLAPHRVDKALKADLSAVDFKSQETIQAALGRFTPKPPQVTAYVHDYVTFCPTCSHQLTNGIDVPYSLYDFCPWCGQRLVNGLING